MTRNTDGRIVSRYGNHETGTVFIDDSPNAKPSERFKMVSTSTIDGKQGLWVCASPDGIHGWRETSSVPAMTGSDTKDVAFFDHAINKYGSLNGGDHSFASRFRPFRNRPPSRLVPRSGFLASRRENSEKTEKERAKMGEIWSNNKSAGRRPICDG